MEAVRDISTDIPEPAELIARARALIPTLPSAPCSTAQAPQHPDPRPSRICSATVSFVVLQPKRWGGYEMELGTFYDVQLALAEGDMSTGWIFGVLGCAGIRLAGAVGHLARAQVLLAEELEGLPRGSTQEMASVGERFHGIQMRRRRRESV